MRHALLVSAAVLALLAACNKPAETGGPAQAAAEPIKLYAMDCGHITATDAGVFSDEGVFDGQARELVDPCYLIRHPKGDLLWDTGLPEALADVPSPEPPPGVRLRISVAKKLTAQLAELGLTPADIEYVSVSHSHFDHLGNGNLFAEHSTFIVDADERAYMLRDEARASADFASYAALENAATALVEGDADYDVFGDGSVAIIQAPGHTPGHTVLMVKLANAGPVLLTGDMWHMAESRADRRVPVFNTDRAQTFASMDKIEALAAETGARVVRQHVPEDFAALPAFPAALD